MLEKQIEKAVCKYAESKGVYQAKHVSPSNRGVPDRIFHYRGVTFYIEFKRAGCQPTDLQKSVHLKLSAHGISVCVVDNVEQGKRIIDILVQNQKDKLSKA